MPLGEAPVDSQPSCAAAKGREVSIWRMVVHMQETRVSSVARRCMLSVEQQEPCLADAGLCSQH